MYSALISIALAAAIFIMGGIILNTQIWYSARAESMAGAKDAAMKMNTILNEAQFAIHTAMNVAGAGCDAEGRYRLGAEVALKPYLRTIFIFTHGKIVCTSLPDNRVLLINVMKLSDSPLILLPAKETKNNLPVLLYQAVFNDRRIGITINDRHIRDALGVSIKDVSYQLRVGDTVLGLFGDATQVNSKKKHVERLEAKDNFYSIEYNYPPLFSFQRLVSQGADILFFLLLISWLGAYATYKYLCKSTPPEELLQHGIAKGEIIPFYQPVVNGLDGTLRGVEVLARWKHPRDGYISPDSFIPLAEKSGLIVPLTRSLMAQVVMQMNAISCKLPDGFHVGINFSAFHISSPTFVEECMNYKNSFEYKNLNLVVEITEREPLDINEPLVNALNKLHKNGFAIALDDFGTGYSGLSYLHDLHIDYIKIDHSFIRRINEHEKSNRLLDCVLDLARKFSISIVAEGVETQEQLDYLIRKNITFLQGYYFFKPVPFAELVMILLSKPKVRVNVE